jgi:predicted anti-sigma-YlaC factor YlaD
MNQHNFSLEDACKEFEADLVLYYYGDDAEADRLRVEQHCVVCSNCRRFLDDLHKLLPQMAKAKELPASFWDSYYREMVVKLAQQREQNSWWQNFFAPVRAWALPAFGTAAVAALALFLVFGKGVWHVKPTATQIPQEILADPNSVEFFKSMDLLESLGKLEKTDGSSMDVTTLRHT